MRDIKVYVRRVDSGEIVRTVPVTNASERKVERVVSGLLINIGPDYYVDDTEGDALR